MPLNNVIRDKQFFQDLRDSDITMRANDFDNQFNQVVNYINNSLITFIDGIAGGAAAGVVGQPNTFLRNIGDGTTDWAAVNSDAFQDYTIEFSKIAQATAPCTILASGPNQIFTQVSSNNTNEVLISQNNDVPIWSKVRTIHLENRGISGIKIGMQAIANEHLQPGILINNLANNSLVNSKFTDNSIINSKFALGALQLSNLGIISLTGYNFPNSAFIARRNFKIGTLTPNQIADYSINILNFNTSKFITRGKIAPGAVVDLTFQTQIISSANPSTQANFTSRVLNPNFRLTGRELALNKFIKTMFEPTAEQAFTDKGC